jgi:uncharacterized OB-fold protein
MLHVTSCTNCGDTFIIPKDMPPTKTDCHKCGRDYFPTDKECLMPVFAFKALKGIK